MKQNMKALVCCGMMALLVSCQEDNSSPNPDSSTSPDTTVETTPEADTTVETTPEADTTVETAPEADTTVDTTPENTVEDTGSAEELRMKQEIDWQGEELYAIVYAYNYENPEDYAEVAKEYLSLYVEEVSTIPEYLYGGDDYYLLISRYPEEVLEIYDYVFATDDLEKGEVLDILEDEPYFILQCNISDLFPNVLLEVEREGEIYSFSPYLSLKDGTIAENPYLKDLTIYPYPSE